MKVTREQAAENRERVLTTASELFRERGFAGIGVSDLMKTAGMTHGAFYGQFESKDDLMAQACSRAIGSIVERWHDVARSSVDDAGKAAALAEVCGGYLSKAHRDMPGSGCVMAALGGDVAREGPAVRAAVTEGTTSVIHMLSDMMPGASAKQRRRQAMEAYATMIGAMVLARAVDDEAMSDEILETAAAAVIARYP